MKEITTFLNQLREEDIYFSLGHYSSHAIMVTVDVPGQKWEIEFHDDGEIDVEIFVSSGEIHGKEILSKLFADHGGKTAA